MMLRLTDSEGGRLHVIPPSAEDTRVYVWTSSAGIVLGSDEVRFLIDALLACQEDAR